MSKGMQWFGTTYIRRFNLRNAKNGHLFQGRFKSIMVENDAYLLRLSCYIHRNPLRAGIVERLADYKWSSYRFYAYKQKTPSWLDTKLILSQVSGKDRNLAYRREVQNYADEKGRIWEDVKHGLVYGSKGFLEDLKVRFLSDQKNVELPQYNQLFRNVDPQKILQGASKTLGMNLESICAAKRISRKERDHRDLLIYLLWENRRFSNLQIGSLLGIGYSNVSRRVSEFRRKLDIDKVLYQKYQSIKSQIKV